MDAEILKKFEEQNQKMDMVFRSVEKTRRYILWHLIINIVVIVLPLIGLVAVIPWFLKVIASAYSIN